MLWIILNFGTQETGTAAVKQGQEGAVGDDLGWFVTYISDPDRIDSILLLSVVEDVEARGGSSYVVGKEKGILDAYLNKE